MNARKRQTSKERGRAFPGRRDNKFKAGTKAILEWGLVGGYQQGGGGGGSKESGRRWAPLPEAGMGSFICW